MSSWSQIVDKAILIREFERCIQSVYWDDQIQSPVHLSIGQELASCLIADNHREGDHVIGNYRSHAIALALSTNYEALILELMGKRSGVSGGKAGSMHLSVPEKNMMWTSAIVGSGVPVACGIAEALKRDKNGNVATVMFGDGSLEEGCVQESLNIASTFKLPLVFILEDNGLAIYTSKEKRTSILDYCAFAMSYGIHSIDSSYQDPVELRSRVNSAYAYVRETGHPCFVRIECCRWMQHVGVNEDWDIGYRDISELQKWKSFDIIENSSIVGVSEIDSRNATLNYKELFTTMFAKCAQEPEPEPSELLLNVY